jgi:hypothetical protein
VKYIQSEKIDNIVTGIITGAGKEVNSILLDWSNFNERIKTNQKKNKLNGEKSPRLEQVKTIRLKLKSGG